MKKVFSTINYIAKVRADVARRRAASLAAEIKEFERRELALRSEAEKFETITYPQSIKFNDGFRQRAAQVHDHILEEAICAANNRVDHSVMLLQVEAVVRRQEKRMEALSRVKATVMALNSSWEEPE